MQSKSSPGGISAFLSIFRLLNRRQQRDYGLVVSLVTLAGCLDLIGISSVIPIISVLVDFEGTLTNPALMYVYLFLGEPHQTDFTLMLTLASVSLIWLSGLVHFLGIFSEQRFLRRINADLSARIYRNHMQEPLERFEAKPIAEFIRNVSGISEMISLGAMGGSIALISRVIVIMVIVSVLMLVDSRATSSIVIVFVTVYAGIYLTIKKYIHRSSQKNFEQATQIQQLAISSYRAFRSIQVDQTISECFEHYQDLKRQSSRRTANIEIIGAMPKGLVETMGLTVLLSVAYFVGRHSQSSGDFVSLMALFGVAAFRLLPSAQQLYYAINRISAALAVLDTEVFLWGRPPAPAHPAPGCALERDFQVIACKGLKYALAGRTILRKFNAELPLGGGVIRLAGPSGCGKSTLMELLIGLRTPEAGEVLLDGKPLRSYDLHQWWGRISYLTQEGYLFEGSTISNVTNGVSPPNTQRLQLVADICGLGALSPHNLFEPDFKISEGGTNLSGGQKSRVLLARALYKDSDVVFLDEAFSALDIQSANSIITRMLEEFSNRCFVMISHRDAELPPGTKTLLVHA